MTLVYLAVKKEKMFGSENETHYLYWKKFSNPIEGKNDYIGYSGQPSPFLEFHKLGVQNGNKPDSRYYINKEKEGELSWFNLFEKHENIFLLGPYTAEDAYYLENVISALIKEVLGWQGRYLKNFGAREMFNGLTEFVITNEEVDKLIDKIFTKDPKQFLNESRETL